MVRIRSDRWYAADGQRRSRLRVVTRTTGTRRLLSLCFLLALVVLMMQKAADPRHVSNAFRALGVPLDDPPAEVASFANRDPTTGGRSAITGASLNPKWLATCDDLIPRLFDETSPEVFDTLASRWYSNGQTAEEEDASAELDAFWQRAGAQLSELADATRTQPREAARGSDSWAESLSRFQQQWEQFQRRLSSEVSLQDAETQAAEISQERAVAASIVVELDPGFAGRLTQYFDQRLLHGMQDGTVWRSSEQLAFWRMLTSGQGGAFAAQPWMGKRLDWGKAPTITTLQLEADGTQWRGRGVRYLASVRRVDVYRRQNVLSGQREDYWQLWVRGADDSNQPVSIYTTDPAAAELSAALEADSAAMREQNIVVYGSVGKRLAYAAASGVEVAPTIFALQLHVNSSETVASPAIAQPTSGDIGTAVAASLLLTALVLGAVLLGWQSKRSSTAVRTPSSGKKTLPNQTGPKHPRAGAVAVAMLGAWAVAASVVLEALQLANDHRPAASRSAYEESPVILASTNALQIGESAASESTDTESQTEATSSTGLPPWATGNADRQRLALLNEQLADSLLKEDTLQSVRQYVSGTSGRIPDQALKALRLLSQVGWERVVRSPQVFEAHETGSAARTTVFTGVVNLAMPVELDEVQKSWFLTDKTDRLYRLEIMVAAADLTTNHSETNDAETSNAEPSNAVDEAVRVSVLCRRIPKLWLEATTLRQPVHIRGLSVHATTAGELQSLPLVVLADVPQWDISLVGQQRTASGRSGLAQLDDVSELSPGLPPFLLELGQLGWDLNHWDLVSSRNQQVLRSDEADAFLSMLRIADKHSVGALRSPKLHNPRSVLKGARSNVGKPIVWRVRLVTGSLVEVDRTAQRESLGGDRYVQFDGFVDLGNQSIDYQVPLEGGGSQTVLFEREFPVTIVAKNPTGFGAAKAVANNTRSWKVGQYALVQGLFYRLWSYNSEMLASDLLAEGATAASGSPQQAAPLVVAAQLSPTVPQLLRSQSPIGWFGWALCLATFAFLAAILFLSLEGTRRGKPGRTRRGV